MGQENILYIAEIPYESGRTRFRYSRYLSPDGSRWVRHGLFIAYHENGQVANEVYYEHGLEHGLCRDYYENGRVAAEGQYKNGKEDGEWRFWNPDGKLESATYYVDGVERRLPM
jgi:antitoxin component YwqK of YwqJK toxin-antitoxin module